MKVPTSVRLVLGLVAGVSACAAKPGPTSSSQPVAATPSAQPEDGTLRPLTQGQVKLAHYATGDGLAGFVLDRTATPAKLQIDGEQDIIELTLEEERKGGELTGHYLVAPDGRRHLFLGTEGSITWYRGRDEARVNSDRAAAALPAATVTGTYVRPRPAYEAVVADLAKIAVRSKNKDARSEDASDLAKIEKALLAADAAMFVRFQSRGATSFLPRIQPAPANISGLGYGRSDFVTAEDEAKRHTRLAKLGGVVLGYSMPRSQGNHIIVEAVSGQEHALVDGTPGIIWETDESSATFVALDGGRYHVSLVDADTGPTIVRGAGLESAWPKPAQDAFFDVTFLSALAKVGVVPQKTVDEVTAADDEWNTCAQRTWKGADAAIDSGKATVAVLKDWAKKVTKACRKSLDKQETLMVAAIEARAKQRRDLFERAKARVISVGANK